MAKWVCSVCGYVYEGDAAPAECPVCHVGADKFKKVEGDLALAAEHEFGVYASTVKNNPEISDEDKKLYAEILQSADEQILLSEKYYRGCLHVRNKYMADRADMLITYCKKDTGGTAWTVKYFQKKYPLLKVVFL